MLKRKIEEKRAKSKKKVFKYMIKKEKKLHIPKRQRFYRLTFFMALFYVVLRNNQIPSKKADDFILGRRKAINFYCFLNYINGQLWREKQSVIGGKRVTAIIKIRRCK